MDEWDSEASRGLAVLAGVVAALALGLWALWLDSWPAWQRAALVVVPVLAAAYAASRSWTRRNLRAAASIGSVLLVLVVLDIGRGAPAARAERAQKAAATASAATAKPRSPPAGVAAPAEPRSRSIRNTLGDGVDEIAASLPIQDRSFPLTVDAAAWIVVGLALVGVWRVIERRSAQRMPGPVQIEFSAAGDTDGKAESDKATFSAALLQNLPEPSATPGAAAARSVTDLAEAAGATTVIARVLSSLKTVLTRPGGYVVKASLLAPVPPGADYGLLVRIVDEWTGDQVAVQRLSGPTPLAACTKGGYWAAATILSRSTRVPTWAAWSGATADALAAYDSSGDIPAHALAHAVALAPSSALLLNNLAYEHELAGEHLDALVLYARAVAAHPRYPTARYRLAVSVTTLAFLVDEQWKPAPLSTRQRVLDALERAARAIPVDVPAIPAASDDVSGPLRGLAGRLWERLDHDNGRARTVVMLLRVHERDFWWPSARSVFRRFGDLASSRWMVRSARLVIDPARLADVEALASDRRSWWHVSYNLACFHARAGRPLDALRWLETALERPGSGQLGHGWLERDPDLSTLHGEPRFGWVAAQLNAGGEGARHG